MVQKKKRGKAKKYLFQGQSTRSKNCFYLDIVWVEEKFISIEPQFYKIMFQQNIEGQAGKSILPFLFLSEMQKKHMEWNTILNPHCWNIIIMLQLFVASVV